MKKIVLLSVVAVIAVAAAAFGPDILGIYRLQNHIDAEAKAYQADGGAWPHLTDVCMGCHGVKGHSLDQSYPSLAGQPALYIATQLRNFASGQRANPNMGPLAMTLHSKEIAMLSDYYSRQTVDNNQYFTPDPALRARGEQLVKSGACVACHGAGLMGHDQFPRLASQGYDYVLEQLDAFAAGQRTEPSGVMKGVASGMSQQDRTAVATYLASLAPLSK